jgi:hypothetical protein
MSTRTWHQHEQVWEQKRGWRCVEKCVACQQTNMFYPGQTLSPKFNGSDYVPKRDDARLTGQLGRVFSAIKDGRWRTVAEVSELTGDPQTSVSCQLRHLRKPRFGSHNIIKRQREGTVALYEYALAPKG